MIKPDYLVILAILFFFGTHFITIYLLNSYQTTAELLGMAEEVVYIFEINPIARYFFQVEALKLVYTFVLMPSFLGFIYYIVRRKNDTNPDGTMAFAIALLIMGIANFLNDFSVLLGHLASG
ncbi:hypothetical protein LCGC14_2479990 [marine sediment metagenome]|uniref:DUF5658 domain-containing protein n=1 Tax=marine sediment metagenome TaxID=412755 RepID=A0A0F9B8N2_9ZZZZ